MLHCIVLMQRRSSTSTLELPWRFKVAIKVGEQERPRLTLQAVGASLHDSFSLSTVNELIDIINVSNILRY